VLEITNKSRGPISIMVRSRTGPSPRKFSILVIPGYGAGKNVIRIFEELRTEHIDMLERERLITVKRV